MSTVIKPKQGIVYECYKGFTDQYGDRCRVGQKFTFDGDLDNAQHNGYYVMDKASGKGTSISCPLDKFMAHFIPAEKQAETKPKLKYKIGDKVEIIDNITSHQFEIGTIVTVTSLDTDGEVNTCKGKTKQGDVDEYFIDEKNDIKPYTEKTKSEYKFKVGDKVMISDDSQWYSDDDETNPINTVGKIIKIYDDSLGIHVEWENGTSNSYDTHDLLLVTGEAKSKSYIDGVENKDSKKLKEKNMNINLSAIAITDLEQIKAIAELIPSVKEQIMAQYPELFEPEVKHKVGNRYEHSDGNTYLLVGEHQHVALANLNTGMIESRTIPVDDYNNISEDDFEMLCDDTEELELIEF
jgi:hypothetical protein